MTQGEPQERIVAVDIELAADVGSMVFHGPIVDTKLIGDLLAREMLSYHLQDSSLGSRQPRKSRARLGELLRRAAAVYEM